MARFQTAKTSLNSGELDPKADARPDLNIFQNGAGKIRNAINIPQGGVIRCPGLKYKATIPDLAAGGIPNALDIEFRFSTVQAYKIILTADHFRVYLNGVLQTTVASPYTNEQIPFVNWTQNLDTLLLFHEDVPTKQFQRQGSHTSWALSNWDFTNIPTYVFEIPIPLGAMTAAATTGLNIVFTSSIADFVVGDVGKYIRYSGGGLAKIISYTSSTVVNADILVDLNNVLAPSDEWFIEEEIISATRGYAKSGAFHQARLLLAGFKSRPDTLVSSRSQAPHDLNSQLADENNPDYGFQITASSDSVVNFQDIKVANHVIILADDGEWYIPVSETTPLTPTNVLLKETSKRGSKIGTKAVIADDGPMFIEKAVDGNTGIGIREMVYVGDTRKAYEADNLTLVAGHLINDPVALAIQKGGIQGAVKEADYVYVVNSDGSLAVFCTLRKEVVKAWSLRTTNGLFKQVGIDQGRAGFLIERQVSGVPVLMYEEFDPLLLLDSAVIGTGAATTANVPHLEGEMVGVFADGLWQGTLQVPVGGLVTFPAPAVSTWQVGLEFPTVNSLGDTVLVETLDAHLVLPEGIPFGKKKRVPFIAVLVENTTGIYINGTFKTTRKFGDTLLDQAPPSFTGTLQKRGNLGWDYKGLVRISHREPAFLTLKVISYEVAVG